MSLLKRIKNFDITDKSISNYDLELDKKYPRQIFDETIKKEVKTNKKRNLKKKKNN